MGCFLSAYQIAEMAMQVEERGFEFYNKIAELDTNEKAKKIFLFLAEEELKHRDIFKTIAETQKHNDSLDEYTIDIAQNIKNLLKKTEETVFNLQSVKKGSLDVKKLRRSIKTKACGR